MSSLTFFLFFIPLLAIILLLVNFLLAPHKPNRDKDSQFECGFSSFTQMSRLPFSISFFIYALLFLLFDLEILLVYPYVVSAHNNSVYGLIIMLIFFILLTIGFVFELGKKALQIDSKQTYNTTSSLGQTIKSSFNIHTYLINIKKDIFGLYKVLLRKYGNNISIILFILIIIYIVITTIYTPRILCESSSDSESEWEGKEVTIISKEKGKEKANLDLQPDLETELKPSSKSLGKRKAVEFDEDNTEETEYTSKKIASHIDEEDSEFELRLQEAKRQSLLNTESKVPPYAGPAEKVILDDEKKYFPEELQDDLTSTNKEIEMMELAEAKAKSWEEYLRDFKTSVTQDKNSQASNADDSDTSSSSVLSSLNSEDLRTGDSERVNKKLDILELEKTLKKK